MQIRKPRIVSSSDVLPAPLPPSRATISPASTARPPISSTGALMRQPPRGRGNSRAPAGSARTSAGRPMAITWPRSRQTSRSQTRVSSSMSWSTITTPRPASRSRRSMRRELLAFAIGSACRRLVEQQEGGTGRDGARQIGANACRPPASGSETCGQGLLRAMACGGRPSRCASSRVMAPPSARSRPPMTLSSVVLPEPLGPISPTISPRPTANDTPARASTPPNRLTTLSSTSRCAPVAANRRSGTAAAMRHGRSRTAQAVDPARQGRSGAHRTIASVATA